MDPDQKVILVAADVPYTRTLLRKTLNQLGHQVKAVESPAQALDALGREPFELVVIDLLRPPGANEHMLLALRVAGHKVPAMLLCANVDRDLPRRLVNLKPVGFLNKPLQTDRLVELLPIAFEKPGDLLPFSAQLAAGRGGRGGDLLSTAAAAAAAQAAADAGKQPIDTERLAAMFGQLPLLPNVLAKILQLTGDEDARASSLAEVISADPRLSGQLLKVVNSAYFGFSRRISTIPEATVVLGSEAIRKLAVGASVSSFFGGPTTLLDRARLWRHSLSVAVASRLVAEARHTQQAEEAFAAGLLHDFGRLALERHFTAQYLPVVEQARTGEETLLALEEQRFGWNHAWISGWLARKWNLPPTLADSMASHHLPESSSDSSRRVAAAVNVGDVLAHRAGYGGIEGILPTTEPSPYSLGLLDLTQGDLDALTPQVKDETAILEKGLASTVQVESGGAA